MSKTVSQKRWQYAQSSLIVTFFAKKSQKAIKNDLNHMTGRRKCAIIIVGIAVRAVAFVFQISKEKKMLRIFKLAMPAFSIMIVLGMALSVCGMLL